MRAKPEGVRCLGSGPVVVVFRGNVWLVWFGLWISPVAAQCVGLIHRVCYGSIDSLVFLLVS